MKFVILVKATKASEAGMMPSEQDLAGVLAYNQELVRAGVMLDGVGLSPTSEGFRIRFSPEGKVVTRGSLRPREPDRRVLAHRGRLEG